MTHHPQPKNEIEIEEYKSCRDLLASNIEIMEKSEIYVIGAVAASAVYCISSKNAEIIKICAWLPLVLAILGSLRFAGLNATIGTLNNYFEAVEKEKKNELAVGGWTTFYRKEKSEILIFSRAALWIILVVGSMYFSFYVRSVGEQHLADCNRQSDTNTKSCGR